MNKVKEYTVLFFGWLVSMGVCAMILASMFSEIIFVD